MLKKHLKVIFIILIIPTICFGFSLQKLNQFILEKQIAMAYKKIFYNNNEFVTCDGWEMEIIKFNSSGKILETSGGRGKGPGYYEHIMSISKNGNKFYLVDPIIFRLTILDEELEYYDSFILRHNYEFGAYKFGKKIITIGHNFTNPFDQQKNYYLGSIYVKNQKYQFDKNILKITKFPNYNTIKSKNKDMRSSVGIPNIACQKYNGKLLILYDYLPYIIKFDPENEQTEHIDLDFPGYVNPLKLNFGIYNKLKKSLSKNFGLKEIVFSPRYFGYDNEKEIFIIQYKRPVQLVRKSDNKNLYRIVIFDKNFKYLNTIYTNLILKTIYHKNSNTYCLFYKYYDYLDKDAMPLEKNVFEIYELKSE